MWFKIYTMTQTSVCEFCGELRQVNDLGYCQECAVAKDQYNEIEPEKE